MILFVDWAAACSVGETQLKREGAPKGNNQAVDFDEDLLLLVLLGGVIGLDG